MNRKRNQVMPIKQNILKKSTKPPKIDTKRTRVAKRAVSIKRTMRPKRSTKQYLLPAKQ